MMNKNIKKKENLFFRIIKKIKFYFYFFLFILFGLITIIVVFYKKNIIITIDEYIIDTNTLFVYLSLLTFVFINYIFIKIFKR